MEETHLLFFCVSLSGHGFDPHAYAGSVEAPAGKVRTRLHSGPPLLDDHPPTYWVSVNQPSSRGTLAADIKAFLESLKQSDPKKWHGIVSVQVIDKSRTNDDRGGYYLSLPLIKLLAEMDADLDIDVAYGDLI